MAVPPIHAVPPRNPNQPSTWRVLRALVSFDLRYQFRQPALWVATLAFVALGVTLITTDIGGLESVRGRVPRNVPFAIVTNIQMISAIGMFATFVFVAGSALRDMTTGAEPLILARPISSGLLLLGRFTSGVAVSLLSIGSGVVAMFVTNAVLADSDPDLIPVLLAPYLYGCGALLVPNVLVFAAAVFLLALWTRRLTATFIGLFVLMVLQDVAEALPVARFGTVLPGLLDPLGFAAMATATRYWSVGEYAASVPALDGLLLANRIVWLAIALAVVVVGVWRFDPRRRGRSTRVRGPSTIDDREEDRRSEAHAPPRVTPRLDTRFGAESALRITRFEYGQMVRSLPFVMIVLVGSLAVGIGISQRESVIGVASLPLTRVVLATVVRVSYLPLTVIAILFSGAAVWRERSSRMSDTIDAYPISLGAIVCGKVVAVCLLLVTAMAAFGVTARFAQGALNFEHTEIALLVTGLGLALVPYLILSALAVALQTVAGSRLLGYVLVCIAIVGGLGLRAAGHDSVFVDLGSGRLPSYSDLDGWGSGLEYYLWAKAYWIALSGLAVVLATLLWPRGGGSTWSERRPRALARWHGGARTATGLCVALAVTCAAVIEVETSGPRRVSTRDQRLARRALYETTYGALRNAPTPSVTRMSGTVDIWPADRTVEVRARYRLANASDTVLSEIHVSLDPEFELLELGFRGGDVNRSDAVLGLYTIRCDPPFAPGAEAELTFHARLAHPGFGRRPSDRWIRENSVFLLAGPGTHAFFRGAQLFPKIGYDRSRELLRTADRKRHGLGAWPGLVAPESVDRARGGAAGHVDRATFDLLVSTAVDHTVVMPGRLDGDWEAQGRRFFRYVSEDPILPMFPIISGRFEVARVQSGNVGLELYHDAQHDWNTGRLLEATRTAVEQFTEIFGPYPLDRLRLAEIPGYGAFACSFPGVMAFAERMGPIAPPHVEGQLDPVLWVVAHEVAHQWWDCQVVPADARGSTMISETLAQYGALRVLGEVNGPAMTRMLARYYRDQYLRGRADAGPDERPLAFVEEQDFVHYAKGFISMRALTRRIGVDRVDAVLRSVVTEYAGGRGVGPTTLELLDRFKEGQSADDIAWIDDTFQRIVFVDAAVLSARARATAGGYNLGVSIAALKSTIDVDGREVTTTPSGAFEIAVHGGPEGVRLLGILRGRFEDAPNVVFGDFAERPRRVVFDPEFDQIDRDLENNVLDVELID